MPLRKFTSILSVALMAAVSTVFTEQRSEAEFIVTSNPNGTTALNARLRWGRNGFEAAVYEGATEKGNLNPAGTPVWGVGNDYKFNVNWNGATGDFSLSVDFNRDDFFGSGEVVSFNSPGKIGTGYQYLTISGNETGSGAGRSNVSGLVINNNTPSTLTPNGTLLDTHYKDDTEITQISISGALTFTTAGTSDERPSWNFRFVVPPPAAAPVPEPITLAAFGLGGLSLLAVRRRLNRR